MAFPVLAAFDIGGKIIDKIWPDPVEANKAKIKLMELQQNGELAILAAETDIAKGQIEINKIAASSPSIFVSGARPAILWICAAGLGIQFIVNPIATWIALLCGSTIVFPDLDMSVLSTMLLGLLGLGTLRTVEKVKGVARNSLK